jgi:MFS family permease
VDTISHSLSLTAWSLLVLETLSVVTIIVFGVANSFTWALGALVAGAVVSSLAGPLYSTWLVQNINPKVRATVLSMNSLTDAFGQTAGGPMIGAIGSIFSLRTAMVVTGGVLSLTLPLYVRTIRRKQDMVTIEGGMGT